MDMWFKIPLSPVFDTCLLASCLSILQVGRNQITACLRYKKKYSETNSAEVLELELVSELKY